MSDRDVKKILDEVREFQETNRKYLIVPSISPLEEFSQIVNMTNTNA